MILVFSSSTDKQKNYFNEKLNKTPYLSLQYVEVMGKFRISKVIIIIVFKLIVYFRSHNSYFFLQFALAESLKNLSAWSVKNYYNKNLMETLALPANRILQFKQNYSP